MLHFLLAGFLRAYGYAPDTLLPLLCGFLSSRIIPAGFSLSLLCVLRRISFAGILARTRYDICSSTLYVLDYCCHSPSECPPFGILVQLSGRTFILPKGVFLSYGSLKLFRNPRLSRGFSIHKKITVPINRHRDSHPKLRQNTARRWRTASDPSRPARCGTDPRRAVRCAPSCRAPGRPAR